MLAFTPAGHSICCHPIFTPCCKAAVLIISHKSDANYCCVCRTKSLLHHRAGRRLLQCLLAFRYWFFFLCCLPLQTPQQQLRERFCNQRLIWPYFSPVHFSLQRRRVRLFDVWTQRLQDRQKHYCHKSGEWFNTVRTIDTCLTGCQDISFHQDDMILHDAGWQAMPSIAHLVIQCDISQQAHWPSFWRCWQTVRCEIANVTANTLRL